MLARSLGNVPVLVHKNRARAGLIAVKDFKADILILDDGMQYLDVEHRLDICLIDRQAPFGNEYLLPRGTLREPPGNLRRANLILITKAVPGESRELIKRIRLYNRTADIVECVHKPVYLENIYDPADRRPLSDLRDKYLGVLSGIARPESFERTLRELGANLEITTRFADHHRFRGQELVDFVARCARRDTDFIVTTEKDGVRFPARLGGMEKPEVSIYFLRVEIEIIAGQENWDRLISRLTQRREVVVPERVLA
jgi:tetraacyldisaccharide 4'-kinase